MKISTGLRFIKTYHNMLHLTGSSVMDFLVITIPEANTFRVAKVPRLQSVMASSEPTGATTQPT